MLPRGSGKSSYTFKLNHNKKVSLGLAWKNVQLARKHGGLGTILRNVWKLACMLVNYIEKLKNAKIVTETSHGFGIESSSSRLQW